MDLAQLPRSFGAAQLLPTTHDRRGGPFELRDLFRKSGAGGRTRTDDLLITNQLLYQLSYAGEAGSVS